jgi:hypothetical protein
MRTEWADIQHVVSEQCTGFGDGSTTSPSGYTCWGGIYGNINAAAGHHITEGRWLRDPRFMDGLIRFWIGAIAHDHLAATHGHLTNGTETGGATTTSYSNWPSCQPHVGREGITEDADCVDRYGLGDRKANPGFWTLVCGLGAGTVESLALTAPTDRVKVLGQALSAERGGIAPTATQLVRERGFKTLYTGTYCFCLFDHMTEYLINLIIL